MIIYPPFIGETIPGFTQTTIKIPFQCNPAVSIGEIKYFRLRIKDLVNSDILCELTVENKNANVNYTQEINNGEITFSFGTWKPTISQYYKFLLSASDDTSAAANSFYAYSQVAIGRCVSSLSGLEIGIYELQDNSILSSNIEFTGYYKRAIKDESLYTYEFNLMDSKNNIIETTGIQRWDTNNDVTRTGFLYSEPKFILKKLLDYHTKYKLLFSVTTINGFKSSVTREFLKQMEYMNFFKGGLVATLLPEEQDNGYISVKPTGKAVHGKFILERSKDKKSWERLTEFEMAEGANLENFVYQDFAIEPSCSYTYALRQYGRDGLYSIYSKQILSNTIVANGEDMFLSDSKKLLKIRFNPKVSSFKDTILEQKTDTIGGKYPFFFRNNKVRYKEIPISGLISYHMDENELFMTNKELGISINNIENIKTTNLTNYNIAAEKVFKLAVNEWLTNGEPKLFRSPTEGTYLIRLMNVSLSPDETLGRMLHTFSATGYEIDDSDYETLKKYNVIKEGIMLQKEEIILETWDYDRCIRDGAKSSYQVRNVVWKTNLPNAGSHIYYGYASSGILAKFYNPSGTLYLPYLSYKLYGRNEFHSLRFFDTIGSIETITIDQNDVIMGERLVKYSYDESKDLFYQNYVKNKDEVVLKWQTYNSGTANSIPDDGSIKQYYTVIAQRDINYDRDHGCGGSNAKPATITFTFFDDTEKEFNLDDGSVREFNDLNNVKQISKTASVSATIFALYDEEEL